jgi:hypothetical protein
MINKINNVFKLKRGYIDVPKLLLFTLQGSQGTHAVSHGSISWLPVAV